MYILNDMLDCVVVMCQFVFHQVTAMDYVGSMTNDQWWSIGGKGGLCAYGDSQCNYDDYKASA